MPGCLCLQPGAINYFSFYRRDIGSRKTVDNVQGRFLSLKQYSRPSTHKMPVPFVILVFIMFITATPDAPKRVPWGKVPNAVEAAIYHNRPHNAMLDSLRSWDRDQSTSTNQDLQEIMRFFFIWGAGVTLRLALVIDRAQMAPPGELWANQNSSHTFARCIIMGKCRAFAKVW